MTNKRPLIREPWFVMLGIWLGFGIYWLINPDMWGPVLMVIGATGAVNLITWLMWRKAER